MTPITNRRRRAALGLVLATAIAAHAQAPVTWSDALARTRQHNAELAAAAAQVRAAEYRLSAAYAGFWPSSRAALRYDDADSDGAGGDNGRYSATVTASQNLYAGGLDRARVTRAQAEADDARSAQRVVHARVSFELKSAFQGLAYAQQYQQLTEEIMRRRGENLDLVQLRFNGGRENKGSVLLSQAYRQQALYDDLQARNAAQVARAQLARLWRSDDAGEYRIVPDLPLQTPPSAPDFAQLALQAPATQQARAQRESAAADVGIARAPLRPSVDVDASIGHYDDEFFPRADARSAVGFSVSVPLFSGGRDYYGVKSAQATRYRADETYENTVRETRAQLERAFAGYVEALAKLDMDASFLAAARVRAEIARRKYNNGLLSFEDWDIIENDLIARQKAHLQSQRERVIAEAAWEQARGVGAL